MRLFKKETWPELPLDEIRKRARLLVIDDQDFYYLPLFQKDGYSIEKWDDVKDLTKLEIGFYDIILLDIQGVGKELSQDQGFGILKYLRKSSPAQIIVAYSNADWSVKYQEFFEMADAVLYKQKDYVDFKRTVDNLLRDRFSLGFYVNRIDKLVAPYITEPEKVRQITQKAILTKSPDRLKQYLDKIIDNKETFNTVLQIVATAIQIVVSMRTPVK